MTSTDELFKRVAVVAESFEAFSFGNIIKSGLHYVLRSKRLPTA